MTTINDNEVLKDKIIKLCSFIEAKIKLNDENENYSNLRLVHQGFKDIWELLGLEVSKVDSCRTIDTKYYYEYLKALRKNKNFFPKGFEEDFLLSIRSKLM